MFAAVVNHADHHRPPRFALGKAHCEGFPIPPSGCCPRVTGRIEVVGGMIKNLTIPSDQLDVHMSGGHEMMRPRASGNVEPRRRPMRSEGKDCSGSCLADFDGKPGSCPSGCIGRASHEAECRDGNNADRFEFERVD